MIYVSLHNVMKQVPISTISSTTLQREVGRVTRRVNRDKEHVIVERGGFPIVAIIPIDEYKQLVGNKAVNTEEVNEPDRKLRFG